MLSLKKRKHRKKTRRKIKKGGKGIRVYHIPSDSDTKLLYPIIEEISLNNAYGKQKYVKDANGKDIIPFFKESLSLSDFVPILDNGEEKYVFDMFLGKYDPNIKVKQSTIYVHSRRDLQMIELYKFIEENYKSKNELLTELDNLLVTYTGNPTKLNNMINTMKKYIDTAAAPAAAAPAAAAPAAATAFKTQFELLNDINLTMYESKILDKLYQEINDDSVKSIMRLINGYIEAPSHKYKLIYSENNDNTYNNIRYVILTLIINKDIVKDQAAAPGAANPRAAPGAAPGAAAIQGNNNNQIPALVAAMAAANPRAAPGAAAVQGNNNNQIPALVAAMAAAANPHAAPGAPAPVPAPGDPLQARALIAAIVAALARP